MRTRNINLFITFCLFNLLTACSNHPTVQSATLDLVVIKAQPEKFLDAYEIAKIKCQENNRYASYIADANTALEIVGFNCIDPLAESETEVEVETEEASPQES